MNKELTLAPNGAEKIVSGLNSDGAGLDELQRHPLAQAEYASGRGRGRDRLIIDTSHLTKYDGTDYVQWVGRVASGHFVPFGRVMKIVKARP